MSIEILASKLPDVKPVTHEPSWRAVVTARHSRPVNTAIPWHTSRHDGPSRPVITQEYNSWVFYKMARVRMYKKENVWRYWLSPVCCRRSKDVKRDDVAGVLDTPLDSKAATVGFLWNSNRWTCRRGYSGIQINFSYGQGSILTDCWTCYCHWLRGSTQQWQHVHRVREKKKPLVF